MTAVSGHRELRGRISALRSTVMQSRLLRGGMAAAGAVLAAGMQREIPERHSEGRKGIGSRVTEDDSGLPSAKVGVGVGVRRRRYRVVQRRQGGVGLRDWNLHWFVRGTGMRWTRRGHRRGRMPAILHNIVLDGARKNKAQALEALSAEMREALEREGYL